MQKSSRDQTIGILTVVPNAVDPYLNRVHVFVYDESKRSNRIIKLISNNFQLDGCFVHSIPSDNLSRFGSLSEENVTLVLFPLLYQKDSGLLTLIANVLCDKGTVYARRLLLVKFHDTVIPSYLEFEDVLYLDQDKWMENLRTRIGHRSTPPTLTRSQSLGHLEDAQGNRTNIQKCDNGRYEYPAQHIVTPEDEVLIYVVSGDSNDEEETSKQITNLLSVAKGYSCRSVSTSDRDIQVLPQLLHSLPRIPTVVLIFETIYDATSKASDYCVLLREYRNIVVLSIEIGHLPGPLDSIPSTSDRKQSDIKLIGKYMDWYKLLLDRVQNVVRKTAPTNPRYIATVDDAALHTSKEITRQPDCKETALPIIITPDSIGRYVDIPKRTQDDASYSSSSRLSSTWQNDLEYPGSRRGSFTDKLTLMFGQRIPTGSRKSLLGRFMAKLDPSVHLDSTESLASRLSPLFGRRSSHESLASRFTPTVAKFNDVKNVGTQTEKEEFTLVTETDSQYKSMFNLFDADSDGSITLDELCQVVKQLGIKWERHKIKEKMKTVDRDGNGQIEFDEFLTLMKSYKFDPAKEMKQMFDAIDEDGDGSITAKEIWKKWNNMEFKCKRKHVKKMIAEVDADHNGVIDRIEFKTLCSKYHIIPDQL